MQISEVMMLLGGLGLFLYGMKLMGDGLEMAAGSRLKKIVEKLTRNKYMGALVGLIVTMIIQSSSSTTVMVVGFVNAGLMTLAQATGVIMGANIGTTVTGLLIAIKLNDLAPIAIFIGVVMIMFIKKTSYKHVGQIIAGFGILFMGMTNMGDALAPLSESQMFKDMMSTFSNPLLGVLIGLVFTAIIQSSSASVGVLMALAGQGVVPIESAVFVIFGQNIGTCVTAVLSCIGTNRTAKRTATVHLLFNIIGATLFICISLFTPFISWIKMAAPDNILMQISIVHITFNVVTTAILLPLSDYLVKLACIVIPGEDEKREAKSLKFLDARILKTPPIAVAQVLKEVARMGDLARKNYLMAMDMLFTGNVEKMKELEDNEEVLNFLNTNITEYLVKINSLELEDNDRKLVGALFHVVSDFERIGDHGENIAEQAIQLQTTKTTFSEQALQELHQMQDKVISVLDDSCRLFQERKMDFDLAYKINSTEDSIDDMAKTCKENHVSRLNQSLCTAQGGAIYNDLITNLERIADHSTNIAFALWQKNESVYAPAAQA